ncbi:Sec-independent protein translocase subunit TatB [Streptomyces profundus]|uniref:sec-independent translocase n=1 Tax=Streptomyces profundus TaxID=2867410 RepID=UPI003CC8BC32|nr:Sec-independent protein translocase subunit TatB [Streptomyces sp. MA3_2.13]
MFFDIGSLEFITLIILAILVFGPEKLPNMIREVVQFVRKIRAFSDNAKQDIRSELGPEFKDFEFEDLNPKTFAKKHLMDNDDLGLRELANDLDVRKELTEVTDAINGRTSVERNKPGGARPGTSLAKQRKPSSAQGAQTAEAAKPTTSLAKDGQEPAGTVKLGKGADRLAKDTTPSDAPRAAAPAAEAAPAEAPAFDLDAT